MQSRKLISSFFILLLLTGCGSGGSGNTSSSSTFFLDYGLHEGDMINVQIMTSEGIRQWTDTSEPSASDTGYQNTALLDAGTTIQLSAIGSDISGIRYNNVPVEWLSDNPSVAVVDNNGTVTGKSPGEATVKAQFSMEDGAVISDNIVVTVLPSPVAGKAWVASKVSLPQPIWDHASVIWNGYLYVAGGNAGCRIDLQTYQFSDCGFTNEVYYAPVNQDGSIGTFMATTPMPRILKGHAMVAYNDYMYIIGGIVNPVFLNQTYPCQVQDPLNNPYDPNNPNDIITSCEDFKTILNEKVYYAKINSDGSIGEWKPTEPLPPSKGIPIDKSEKSGLFALSAAAHTITGDGSNNGYIYVTGGWSTELETNVRQVLIGVIKGDGSIDTWIHDDKLDLPYDLSKHASVTATVNGSDYLYIIGGNSGKIGSPQKFHNEIYYAKIASDGILAETEDNGILSVWKHSSNSLPVQLIDHAAISADKYIFVLGGRDGDDEQDKNDEKTPYNIWDKVYLYTINDDGDLGVMNRYPDLPEPLFHHAAVADINKSDGSIKNIYVTGGAGGNTWLQENRKSSVYYLTDTP
ncbi:MAG: Ig-like domain-containing protein [Nitrospirae bacterium]|nr:Ig-like domain-containing protein [Nitrospirota bacterium]